MPVDPLDDKLPEDPAQLRAYVKRLRSLFRLWANAKGTTPEEGFRRASAIMREIRAMLGEPTAEDEIEALRALEGAENGK
jgi:hypothetical protein